jgi:hypothetical protein
MSCGTPAGKRSPTSTRVPMLPKRCGAEGPARSPPVGSTRRMRGGSRGPDSETKVAAWFRIKSASRRIASQPRQMSGRVDKEQIIGIVKELAREILCLKFQLDLVIADDTRIAIPLPQIEYDLFRRRQRRFPSSSPTPRPTPVRSTWPRPAMGARPMSPASCSR